VLDAGYASEAASGLASRLRWAARRRRSSGASLGDAGALGRASRAGRTCDARVLALFGRENGSNALHAFDVLDDLFGSLAQRLELFRPVGGNGDGKVNAIVLQQDLGDEAELDQVALEVRTFDPMQPFEDLRLRDRHITSLAFATRACIAS
jgi:hypothetical protein